MPESAIDTAGLRKEFARNVAVADLSLTVGRGEVFGFLGPNGAGKTTSLKLLIGLVEPTAGSGTVLGAPLGDRGTRARIGFLPEHFRFHDCLTANELLDLHGRLLGLREPALAERRAALLNRVGLEDAADRPLKSYSKGMVQRVGLAQALLGKPDLVFLDEPTSGLDPLGRLLVRELIDELRAGGTTVFLNSHLLGEVEATCDRVAFVKRGRVIHELVLAEMQSGVDVEIRVAGADAALVHGLRDFGSDARLEDGLVRLRVDDDSRLPAIARWLAARNAELYELKCRRRTLEEWFVALMGDDQGPG
jgi:ABC-2 type transport system ATP-binding protein